ncbi:MAG TPA: lysophospholipid acyltransferase family protein [Kofleriaceae bacterium]|nr:lysophospholipid acyltransferase family protein [Kofleriaceae bacterium]
MAPDDRDPHDVYDDEYDTPAPAAREDLPARAPRAETDTLDSWHGNAPDAQSWGPDSVEDVFLGEEAVVPPGEYAAPRRFERGLDEREVRELEARMDAQRTPAFPLDVRRRVGMPALWKRVRRMAMLTKSEVVDDFGRDPIATARWEPVLDFLYARWFRVEASGLEHVPGTGRALLVANHAGTLPYDSAMVMHAVRRDHPSRRDVRPLIEDAVFHLPWLGPLMQRIGGVRACPENAERLLSNDELVAVFPEGVKGMGKLWRDRYRLQRFGRGGFIKLALRSRAPLIPVAVIGAEEALPMFAKVSWFARNMGLPYVPVTPTFPWLGPAGLLPLPSKWMVEFGAPIDLASEYGPDAADDRLLVNRLADQVRATIQDMVDGLRSRRRSLFR